MRRRYFKCFMNQPKPTMSIQPLSHSWQTQTNKSWLVVFPEFYSVPKTVDKRKLIETHIALTNYSTALILSVHSLRCQLSCGLFCCVVVAVISLIWVAAFYPISRFKYGFLPNSVNPKSFSVCGSCSPYHTPFSPVSRPSHNWVMWL